MIVLCYRMTIISINLAEIIFFKHHNIDTQVLYYFIGAYSFWSEPKVPSMSKLQKFIRKTEIINTIKPVFVFIM